MNRPRKKPDLHNTGMWLDPHFFSDEVLREFGLHLKASPLTAGQKAALIDHAVEMAQMVEAQELETYKAQRKQIEAVEANARRLLASLTGLSRPARDAFEAHADYLAFGSEPSIELPVTVKTEIMKNGLLSPAWDWAEALEKAAGYAAGKYSIDRQSKPEQNKARGFVALVAESVIRITGKPPPADSAAWFAGFVGCAGAAIGLKIGPRVVLSGIKAIR